jgi:hypothetical protein
VKEGEDPNLPPPPDPVDTTPPEESPIAGPGVGLSRSVRVRPPPAAKRAQAYVADVASVARDRAAKALRPDLQRVLAAIDGAGTYDEMRDALAKAFAELDPHDLADVTEHALVLAQLVGRHAILEDTRDEREPQQPQ